MFDKPSCLPLVSFYHHPCCQLYCRVCILQITIYEEMAKVLKESSRFGSDLAYRNFQALACCLLLQGLRVINQSTKDSTQKRSADQQEAKKR